MIAFNSKKKRFSLIYLDENEIYIEDLSVKLIISD